MAQWSHMAHWPVWHVGIDDSWWPVEAPDTDVMCIPDCPAIWLVDITPGIGVAITCPMAEPRCPNTITMLSSQAVNCRCLMLIGFVSLA